MFTTLKIDSINNWAKLEKRFLAHFSIASKFPKSQTNLTNIKQRIDESLMQFIETFKKFQDDIDEVEDFVICILFSTDMNSIIFQ